MESGPAHDPQDSTHWLQHPLSGALLSFIVILALLAVLVHHLSQFNARERQREIDHWAGAFTTKLRGRLEANLAVGYGLEAQISVLDTLNQDQLDRIAPRLLQKPLNIRHIAVAPDLVVTALYPLTGNEGALGLNYRQHAGQRTAVLQAMAANDVVLAGPVRLVQGGGEHLIARFPVRRTDGSEWGLISLVIEIESLLRDSDIEEMQRRYALALRGIDGHGDRSAVFWGDANLFGYDKSIRLIPIPGGEWQIAMVPLQDRSWLVLLYWGGAFVIALMAGVAMYYLRRYHLQQNHHLAELQHITAKDPLTQLTSRYQFNEYLRQLVEESQRSMQGFAVLYIDLDHFKDINDSLGHAAGDLMLIEVARHLKASVRTYDLLCRVSGDEFVAVLKGVTATADIENRARIIRNHLAENMHIHGNEVNINCSIGVAVYPHDGSDADALIQHADLAMHESKRAGRNTLYFFSMSMREEANRYRELSAAMRTALNDRKFAVYYQPIYSVRDQSFTRCEALCRWPQADGSMISPAEFIPVAEQSGLICDLGAWLMEEVLTFCQTLKAQQCELNFSVNRSPQEFGSRQHTQQLIALRNRLNIPTHLLTLEITESLLMSDNGIKSQNLMALREQHFQFSIDDFGTGYSAINYLRQYPVESLKIDKSFIAELGVSRQADTLVKVIIQMAKSLGIKVVAEGVETQRQVDFLCAIGCDYLQGFYFARPMPKEQFMAFIFNQKPQAASP
jgi:diguanylate cyclase (GGDEF)-like protein